MNVLSRLNIGARLAFSFGVVVTLLIVLAAFTLKQLAAVGTLTEEARTAQAERLALAQEWRQNIAVNSQRALAMGIAQDAELASTFEADVKRTTQRTSEIQKQFTELETTPDGKALLEKLGEVRKRYVAQRDATIKATSKEQAHALAREFKPTTVEYIEVASALVDFETARNRSLAQAIDDAMAFTRRAMLATTALCIMLACVLGWALTRSIVHPLAQAVSVAETVAAGDLTSSVQVHSRDETGRLLEALQRMNKNLVEIVGQVRNGSDSIATGSTQIATGNADLSQRTEEQASNLQQTAASMEQLTVTVKQNAETAQQANQLATGAFDSARQGGEVVERVVATMDQIGQSSKRIADIIGVIDGIAFQTNILALNAAVEAARAGEQGRGFAVVAGEVRSLARRSAEAAKEIKSLIGESVDKVETGTQLVGEAGRSMGQIVAQVRRVSDLIAEISASSAEQSSGIGQIGDAVTQLDQVTQQNAALVEESAAAAESLKQQATHLARAVSVFKL